VQDTLSLIVQHLRCWLETVILIMTIYKWAISLRSFDPLKKQNSDLFCSSSLEVALIKYVWLIQAFIIVGWHFQC